MNPHEFSKLLEVLNRIAAAQEEIVKMLSDATDTDSYDTGAAFGIKVVNIVEVDPK